MKLLREDIPISTSSKQLIREIMQNRVLIIGAGSAGLLVAHNMKKLGIPYTVFEQDAAIDARPRDWSFGVYWAQTRLGECLPEGVDEKFLCENAQVDDCIAKEDFVLPTFNGETGELMKNIPTPFVIRLQRKKFIKLLSQGLKIEYGKRLSAIQSEGGKVTVSFEDGTKEEGSLLIGCDGARSKVRDFLLGPDKAALRPLPFLYSAVLASLPEATALAVRKTHPRFMNVLHPNGFSAWTSIQDCSDPDPSKWTFFMLQTWREANTDKLEATETAPMVDLLTRPEIVKDVKSRASVLAEPFKSFWQAVPDDAPAWHGRLSDWPTEPWDNRNGTVTLAGDAAHPMTFHRGQGLNNAINDVCTLLHALKEHYPSSDKDVSPFAGVLQAYEKEVWERGREAVLSSAENSLMVHDWKRMTQSAVFRYGVQSVEQDVGNKEAEVKA